MSELALVVLAAGASERLGSCKATVDLGGTTPLAALLAAGTALRSTLPPLVVGGAHHGAIAAELARLGARCDLARNRGWERGRAGTIALAARARRGHDLVLAPVDVPLVPASVFAALAAEWQRADRPSHGWLAPRVVVAGAPRYGHPVVLGRGLAEKISAWIGERGADAPLHELRARAAPLWSLPVDSPRVLDDLDTPEDLARLREI